MTKALVTGGDAGPRTRDRHDACKRGLGRGALGRDRIALVEMHGEHKIVPLAMDLTDRAYVCAVADGLAIDSGFQPHIIERQEDGYGT